MRELEVVAKLTGHAWQCSSVHFHPAGNMLASASWDRTVRSARVYEYDESRSGEMIVETGGVCRRPLQSHRLGMDVLFELHLYI